MLKRDLGAASGTHDQHRAKRRKETSTGNGALVSDAFQNGQGGGEVEEALSEQALRLWQTVRDATNKDGRPLAHDFIRRPSKRQYPDYYVLIAQPIALEDIKKKIEDNQYDSLEAVRQDFELCFRNAKQYNMKESVIWNDARELLKLTIKTYNKMVPHAEGEEVTKEKAPSLTRMLKHRLQKMSDKADDNGRILVTEFMELPSKKLWPLYYQVIKEPMCVDTITGRLKRKEYHSSLDFFKDVELIFSNAMSFNQEHTQIWEDALTLRDYFRQLMSDLPEPFALPEELKPAPKLKLKISMKAQSSRDAPEAGQLAQASSSKQTLRIPAPSKVEDNVVVPPPVQPPAEPPRQKAATPVPPVRLQMSQSTTSSQPSLPQQAARTQTPTPAPIPVQPLAPAKQPIPSTPVARTPSVHPPQTTVQQAQVNNHQASNSPAPAPERHPFKLVLLKVEQTGRLIGLDYRDGVQSWVMRLAPGEKDVRVSRVLFLEDDVEDGSEAEDGDVDDTAEPAPKRKRGRPPKVAKPKPTIKASSKPKAKRKPVFKLEDVQIKLNGQAKSTSDSSTWSFELTAGSNVLEVSEKSSGAWRVYIERL